VEHFGKNPILSRVHPDLKEAQSEEEINFGSKDNN
jgi:hypothetical protein